MRRVVRGVRRLALRSTDGERGACPQSMSVQSPWIQKLLGERERVERCDEAVSLLSRKIHAALPTGDIALLDAAGAPFLWMTNTVGRLPNGDKSNAKPPYDMAEVAATGASEPASIGDGSGQSDRGSSMARAYLRQYAEKMSLWGSWFTAQYITCGTYGLRDFNAIGAECVALRQRAAWSVPCEAALAAAAAHGPLIEMGAGAGLWAKALRERGVDIEVRGWRRADACWHARTCVRGASVLRVLLMHARAPPLCRHTIRASGSRSTPRLVMVPRAPRSMPTARRWPTALPDSSPVPLRLAVLRSSTTLILLMGGRSCSCTLTTAVRARLGWKRYDGTPATRSCSWASGPTRPSVRTRRGCPSQVSHSLLSVRHSCESASSFRKLLRYRAGHCIVTCCAYGDGAKARFIAVMPMVNYSSARAVPRRMWYCCVSMNG